MIDLLVTRTIMRLKFVIMLVWVSISWSKCRPPDWYYWTNSTSWTNWILTSGTNWILASWSKIQPPEKVEFWSHEIRPHDHFPNSVSGVTPSANSICFTNVIVVGRKANKRQFNQWIFKWKVIKAKCFKKYKKVAF